MESHEGDEDNEDGQQGKTPEGHAIFPKWPFRGRWGKCANGFLTEVC
jgi:hypothetical protein